MAYRISLKSRAEKELKRIPKPNYYRILLALNSLADNPYFGKKLEGEFKGCFSLVVWPYRIIYQVYKNELLIIVIRIRHRQGAYK